MSISSNAILKVRLHESTSSSVAPGIYLFRKVQVWYHDNWMDAFELASVETRRTLYRSTPIVGAVDEWGFVGMRTLTSRYTFEVLGVNPEPKRVSVRRKTC